MRASVDTERLDRATADLEPPFVVVDLTAFDANADDLVRRAAGTPIRVASKSIRVRTLLRRAVERPGFAGVMSFALPEAIWLVRNGVTDVLMGYPTADRTALAALASDEALAAAITLTVDDVAQVDLVEAVVGRRHPTIRLCVDIDTSYRVLGAWLGARRSPVRTPEQAVALVRELEQRQGFQVVGALAYEAQLAGVSDRGVAVRWMKRRSAREIETRRAVLVRAVESITALEFVNAGGTGNLELAAFDPTVTEVTAGSGLLGPRLFDDYRAFTPRPACVFALPVVRRPGSGAVTVFSGGWIASGPAGRSRWPTPVRPPGLRLTGTEGAGEVQTPLLGRAADGLRIGDRVWFRHAKAGEPMEHVDVVHLIEGDRVVDTVPTYRGEGRAFGV
ncbi:MAG TPA: amino acid deaminase/aldolase [Actinopolymorphaceae bacterium]